MFYPVGRPGNPDDGTLIPEVLPEADGDLLPLP